MNILERSLARIRVNRHEAEGRGEKEEGKITVSDYINRVSS